jgi:transcription-repair coupling factor (superfamily II helicase)
MIYTAVTEGRKFPGYENLLPMFYKALASINDYLNNPLIIYDHLSLQSILEFETSYLDLYQSRLQSNKVNPSSFYPALPPARLYFSSQEVKDLISHHESIFIDPGADNDKQSIKPLPSLSHIDKWQEFIGQNPNKILILCAYSPSGIERFKTLMNSYEYHFVEIEDISSAKKGLINLVIAPFASGYITDDYIFITGRDIFGEKYFDNTKSSSKRRLKNILTELDNLQPNELVVHIEHGIGKFLGVEIIEVQGNPHDCLKILYADNDKLYIPVEDIDSIKKYGHNEAELDRLGSLAWQKRKSKLKNKISEIAATLIKTAASRALTVCEPIEFDVEAYEKFCDKFNYAETEDQLTSINDIQEDFKSGKLMDRLICGDVGFGKTEVAMRATYMIAAGQEPIPPQVAIVVPTTILCGQHYTRFLERFQGFPFRIAQLSRLITPKQAKAIKEDLQNGKVNILIGTHALLSKEIKFQNLRLLIIDEEQHFGVAQKEHLKELKTSVHTISLSATPIPRTLQMSMVGIKDLSLIATPPIDRLAIRTTVMPFDGVIIRDALLRERFRGGRSFYVAPRIKDLEDIAKILKEIVPELTFKIAHGQMSAASIDDIMTEFYEGKFDILLSTTIVESGIDVSSANTIVIHKADKLGLSQLYQLRGRIGRGKLRGYAYLTLDPRKSSPQALRRLEIMQSIDSLGAGFTIASHDMDLRGFGNLVGEEQSGHVKEVGSELYQEMLDQAIAELQNEPELNQETELSPSINLGLPVFIPDSYIEDSALRLGIYRRVGNLLDSNEVEKFIDEMVDRFGPIPDEFKNLLEIVKLKKLCNLLHISNLDSGEKGFLVKFWEKTDVSNVVLSFITSHPRHAKIRPDNKLVFLKNLNPKNILQEAENFLNSMMMR